jgi:hypothetical protein
VSDYIARAVEEWFSAAEVMKLVMAVPKENRASMRNKLVYVSPYRPVRGPLLREEGVSAMDVAGGSRGLVFSSEPLAPETIEANDLLPVGPAAAWALLAAFPLPIELGWTKSSDRERAVLVHLGTDKKPRVTYFEEGIGPTGHQEGDLVENLTSVLSMGYRRVQLGVVDAIMSTLG